MLYINYNSVTTNSISYFHRDIQNTSFVCKYRLGDKDRIFKRVTTTPRPLSFIIYEPSKYIFTFLVNGPLDIEIEKEKKRRATDKTTKSFFM